MCGYLERNSEDQHREDQRPERPVSKHLQRGMDGRNEIWLFFFLVSYTAANR